MNEKPHLKKKRIMTSDFDFDFDLGLCTRLKLGTPLLAFSSTTKFTALFTFSKLFTCYNLTDIISLI